MAHKEPTGLRKPMSDEAKARIADAVRLAAARKRQDQGLPPLSQVSANVPPPAFIEKPLELVRMSGQYFSPDLFIPMKTGKPVDQVFTSDGGIDRKSVV